MALVCEVLGEIWTTRLKSDSEEMKIKSGFLSKNGFLLRRGVLGGASLGFLREPSDLGDCLATDRAHFARVAVGAREAHVDVTALEEHAVHSRGIAGVAVWNHAAGEEAIDSSNSFFSLLVRGQLGFGGVEELECLL